MAENVGDQWATSASYVTPATDSADSAAHVHCGGSTQLEVYSSAATLTVSHRDRPSITTQPTSATCDDGAAASFSVTATSRRRLAYQ